MIILHRPFAQFKQRSLLEEENVTTDRPTDRQQSQADRLCQLSRMVCFDHAVLLAKVLKKHHDRFNARRTLFHAVGHADVCATTLFMTLIYTKDPLKREMALGYLQNLLEVLEALGATYPIGAKMCRALDGALNRWRNDVLTCQASNPIGPHTPTTHAKLATATATATTETRQMNQLPTNTSVPLPPPLAQPPPVTTDRAFLTEDHFSPTLPLLGTSAMDVFDDNFEPIFDQPLSADSHNFHQIFLRNGIDTPLDMDATVGWGQGSSWDILSLDGSYGIPPP